MRFHRVTVKVILMASLPMALLFIFYLSFQFSDSRELTDDTSEIVTQSIASIYNHNLRTKSNDLAKEIQLKFQSVINDLSIVTRAAQHLIDTPSLNDFGRQLREINQPYFLDELSHDENGQWSINQAGDHNTSVSIFSSLHKPTGKIKASVSHYSDLFAPMKFILPIVQKYGTPKEWMYIVGPHDAALAITAPWANMPQIVEQIYPGANSTDYWDFFFPGMIEGWQRWVNDELKANNLRALTSGSQANHHETTWTPLYEDGAGQGKMVSLFRPLWSKNREAIEGGVGLDLRVSHIINLLSQDDIGDTGFAFLMQSNTALIGLPDDKLSILGLKKATQENESGVKFDDIKLNQSQFFPVKTLASHVGSMEDFELTHFSGSDDKEYIVSIRRANSFNLWDKDGKTIRRDSIYVGILVATDEILKIKSEITETIQDSFGSSLSSTIVASVLLFLLTLLLTGFFSYRATRQIRLLNEGVEAIKNKQWGYKVDIVSQDELGDLGNTFNKLNHQLKESYERLENYTKELENTVSERTKSLQESNRKLQELATVDSLTQIYNRRYFDEYLSKTWRTLERSGKTLSVILIDIDFFKQYNDTYGHRKGDECLRRVAYELKSSVMRGSDCLARYGGEEFVVITQQSLQGAMSLAYKLKKNISSLEIPHESSPTRYVSISLGICSLIPSENYLEENIIQWADEALYKSKKEGRNRVSSISKVPEA